MKVLEVDGGDGCVAPTPETIADNSYPVSRPLFIYVNKAKAEENPALTAWVDFYLGDAIGSALGKKGTGTFVIPGLCKIVRIHKPATPERQGINPFTKEPTTIKAKPARNVVKVRPLKKLKAMV